MIELKDKALYDVHKLVYIANEHQSEDIRTVAGRFQMAPFDFNAAAWRAQAAGFLHIDQDSGKIDVLKVPENWEFGRSVDFLIETMPFVFGKLAERETDLHDEFFMNYVQGYSAQDIEIALKWLMNKGIMSQYIVKNTTENEGGEQIVDEYKFYCLKENESKEWGRQQFEDETRLEK